MTVLSLSIENYADLIKKDNSLILIEFWADWCGPCKNFSQLFDLESEKNNFNEKHEQIPHVTFARVDVDKNIDLTSLFGIKSLPTLLGIHQGQVVFQQQGNINSAVLENRIRDLRNFNKT